MSRLILSLSCCAGACLVWAMVALAAPSQPRGKLQGKTAQGRHIIMRVAGDHLDLLHFSIRLKCRDGSVLIDEESGFQPTDIRRNGFFRDDQVGSTDEVWLRGRVRAARIAGRVRVTDRFGHVRCNSGWVAFNAKPKRR